MVGCFWIDSENQKCYCVAAFATTYGNTWIINPTISSAYQEELYQIITGLIPPAFNWVSVPSVSGKNGILSLSTIEQSAINDGNPVTGAGNEDVHLADQTWLNTLITNIPYLVEADVIYAGSVDYMSISRGNIVLLDPKVNLKFYMGGSSTPFYTISPCSCSSCSGTAGATWPITRGSSDSPCFS